MVSLPSHVEKKFQELGVDVLFLHFTKEGKPFQRREKLYSSIPNTM
jgi:hypothetical protein